MENNQSNITEEPKNNEELNNSDELSQQTEKTFSQEEVSQLIKSAKENNDSNEVAYLLKDGKVTKVYGDQDSVSVEPGEKATELLFNSKANSIIMLHNHPGQSGFSLNDISLFIRLNSIKSMTIVTNYGKTKYLTKVENYSKEVALSLYKEMLIDVGNQV
ncbi:hypothetical protein ABH527_000890, partial [Staphylococcus warneri]